MSNSKHTPGPWIKSMSDALHIIHPAPTRFPLAQVWKESDAFLIASAPELLEQLIAMTDAYAKAMQDAGVTRYPEALAVVRKARSVILKANGGVSTLKNLLDNSFNH